MLKGKDLVRALSDFKFKFYHYFEQIFLIFTV